MMRTLGDAVEDAAGMVVGGAGSAISGMLSGKKGLERRVFGSFGQVRSRSRATAACRAAMRTSARPGPSLSLVPMAALRATRPHLEREGSV